MPLKIGRRKQPHEQHNQKITGLRVKEDTHHPTNTTIKRKISQNI